MLRSLSVSLGITLLIAVTGCSGAESSDLFGPEAAGGSNGSTDSPAASTDSTTPEPGGETAPSPSKTDEPSSGEPKDPGTAPDPDPTKPVCAAESLDNDDFRSADAFDSCIAGKLVGKDVDYVSVVAPQNAKQIFIEHTESGGKVAYKVFVNGFSATFTDTPPADLMAFPGAKYTFKIEPSGTTIGDRSWQLSVSFQ